MLAAEHSERYFGNSPAGFDTAGPPADIVRNAIVFEPVKIDTSAPSTVCKRVIAFYLDFNKK